MASPAPHERTSEAAGTTDGRDVERSTLTGVARQLVWSALFALAAAVAVGAWSDVNRLVDAFRTFAWEAIPIAVGLTVVNATIRFVKWHFYCHRVGAYPSLRDSAVIFIAGFALTVTPGKSGELLKAWFLSKRTGVPAWRGAPISIAERATDGFAIIILTGWGLTIIWDSWMPVALAFAGALGGCAVLAAIGRAAGTVPTWARPIEAWMVSLPVVGRFLDRVEHRIRDASSGAASLFDVRSLALAVSSGILSWGAESVALWYALHAFGLPADWSLMGYALVALNAGTLAGAISLMPGGAGAADATIAAVLVGAVSHEVAGAATLIIRLCTVWFGAILGIFALIELRDCFASAPVSRSAASPTH
jgi:uncharacterized protein (TIRG00374 family)